MRGGQAERGEVAHHRTAVEDADDDLLAVEGGQRRDAQVDAAVVEHHLHAPVLRRAALGDVHGGHDLDARHDGRRGLGARAQHLAQHAVHAEADAQQLLARLDVDVAGPVADRAGHDVVHDLDDLGEAGLLLDVADVLDRLGDDLDVLLPGILADVGHVQLDLRLLVGREAAGDVARMRDDEAQLEVGQAAAARRA